MVWKGWDFLHIVEKVAITFGGLLLIFYGFNSIFRKKSFVHYSLEYIIPIDLQKENIKRWWITWINLRVPNPDKQKELLIALKETYPEKKPNYIRWSLLIAVGVWMLLTFLSSVFDWIIQNGLDRIFHQ